MKQQILNRTEALREVLHEEKLAAFIFPSKDPHGSEYVPKRWKGREWISGFDGSAGTAVVSQSNAALWTDSRYFLAAAEQLQGTGFKLMKSGLKDTPSIPEWLNKEVYDTGKDLPTEVGIDGNVCSHTTITTLKAELGKYGITLRTNLDPLQTIWKDRPEIPENSVEVHPLKYAGETAESKLGRIRTWLVSHHAEGLLVPALDDVAWALNLRGSDIHCNPVFTAYLIVETDKATLFVDAEKVTRETSEYLKSIKVEVKSYNSVEHYLHRDYFHYNLILDPDETNERLYQCAHNGRTHIIDGHSPIAAMKAIKNKVEIEGFHNAMERDGVAMVKFLKWLKPAVERGGQTEVSVSDQLLSLRREQPLFRDISFDTISGYGSHGAIVHYEATEETDIPLQPKGFLLLDSGAQYLDGTTDITRTIALGPVSEEERRVYTLVLKAHIALERAVFPDGACGTQIDAVAREPLWREGLNFLHGTGHGVGSYLNVHEGPHQIRMEYKPAPLHAGMTVTDEPGIYVEGKFGVRIENTLLIRDYKTTAFGHFLSMEPLTLCPIDLTPVDFSLMTAEEIEWLRDYHKTVMEKLSPLLNEEEKEWLRQATTINIQ